LTSPCWRDISQSNGIAIQVQTRLEDSLPELYCNESELREALTNVVFNAVDALPRGGLITLSARAITQANSSNADRKPTHVVLEVSDNGIGMDEMTRQRCLEPFFSTKRKRGGSGLGLAMVYGVMERHEGHIEVQSAVNQGTTVSLIFPLREPPKPATADLPGAAKAAPSLRILCIDDEPLLRKLLKEILEYHHHEVQTADGGQAGLDAFHQGRSRGQPFDAVITDLGMPDVNGRQVAEKIKAESPNTPVIMLTGWGTMLEEDGEGMGNVDAILSKPPRLNDLVDTLVKLTGPASPTDKSCSQRYSTC
jgi:CheY-like chemotaxis protein